MKSKLFRFRLRGNLRCVKIKRLINFGEITPEFGAQFSFEGLWVETKQVLLLWMPDCVRYVY
jgi:hypothetical protein